MVNEKIQSELTEDGSRSRDPYYDSASDVHGGSCVPHRTKGRAAGGANGDKGLCAMPLGTGCCFDAAHLLSLHTVDGIGDRHHQNSTLAG